MYSITPNVNKVRGHWNTPANNSSFSLGHLRERLLHIDAAEASFARRRFRSQDDQARLRLEEIGVTFLLGYNAAIATHDLSVLAQQLKSIAREVRGFAFEGAAMGLTLLDGLTPWRPSRLRDFIAGPGAGHVYMVHVGAGWAIAKLPWLRFKLTKYLQQLHPLFRWLVLDGYGFHEGYFNWPRYVEDQRVPRRLSAYGLRVFDQGLGRSLWFIEGADVERIPATIKKFSVHRRADLWSGIGLACAYAGGANANALELLRKAAASYSPHMAQGVAFAAKTRELAGNPADHTDLACRIFAGLPAIQAAAITDESLKDLPADNKEPAYEIWRERIRSRLDARNSS